MFFNDGVACSFCDRNRFSIFYIQNEKYDIVPLHAKCLHCNTKTTAIKTKIIRLENSLIMEWAGIPSGHGRTAEAVRRMMRRCIYDTQVDSISLSTRERRSSS